MNKNIFFILHLFLFLNSYLVKAQTSNIKNKVIENRNPFQELAVGQNVSCSFDFKIHNTSMAALDVYEIEDTDNTQEVKFLLKLIKRTENQSIWEFEQKKIEVDFFNFIINRIVKGVEKIELTEEEQNNLLSTFRFQFTVNHYNRNITMNDSNSIRQILAAYKTACQNVNKRVLDFEMESYEYNEEEANPIWEENTTNEISEVELPTLDFSEDWNNNVNLIDYGDKTSSVNVLGFNYYGEEVDQLMGFLNEFKMDLYSITFDSLVFQESLFFDMLFPYIQSVFDVYNMNTDDKQGYSNIDLTPKKQIDYWNIGFYNYYTNTLNDTMTKEGTWFTNKQNDEIIQRNQNEFFRTVFSSYFKSKGIEEGIDFSEAFTFLESTKVMDYGRIKIKTIKNESKQEVSFTKSLEDKVGFRMDYNLKIEY
jgi:hypothetical protein